MRDMEKRTLIVYGNCQAEAIGHILTKLPRLTERFEVAYLRSFHDHSGKWQELDESTVAGCSLLLHQRGPRAFPYRAHLPEGSRVITFPSLDCMFLWPFHCENPYNRPEPPEYPFGRLAYGDRVILDCLEKGMPPDDVIAFYLNSWDEYAPELDRFFELESARLDARDRYCEVKIGNFVLNEFRNRQLFWTVNHPRKALIYELVARLLQAGLPDAEGMAAEQVSALADIHFGTDPLGELHIPVHPSVAQHFRLRWYSADERYGFSNNRVAYTEYFRSMIEVTLERRHLVDPTSLPSKEKMRTGRI